MQGTFVCIDPISVAYRSTLASQLVDVASLFNRVCRQSHSTIAKLIPASSRHDHKSLILTKTCFGHRLLQNLDT
jgi:hypothetical protein